MVKVQLCALAALFLIACSCTPEKAVSLADLNKREVKMPDGTVIVCETMTEKTEMMRGMMFRDQLPANRGLLFIHANAAQVPYYMYQVKIPLDIIWMDRTHTIVEIAPNTPPCSDGRQASQCPQYGGNKVSQYVVEIGAGLAAKHGVKVGGHLDW